MAVEPITSVNRQVVPFTWDQSKLDGEVVQFQCVNAETGGVSTSGLSKNDGNGIVSYPLGYAGITHITVVDNHGNTDEGFIEVDGSGNASTPEPPENPPDVPPLEPPPDEGNLPPFAIQLPGTPIATPAD